MLMSSRDPLRHKMGRCSKKTGIKSRDYKGFNKPVRKSPSVCGEPPRRMPAPKLRTTRKPNINGSPRLGELWPVAMSFRVIGAPYFACARMLGHRPEDLVGNKIAEVIGEEEFQTILPHVNAVLTGQRISLE